MSLRKLTREEAVMLLPASVDRDRVIDALAWLGLSRDLVGSLAGVTFEPGSITFELWSLVDDDPTLMTVEAKIR